MKKSRLNSFILILLIIVFGLFSRTAIIPDLIYPYLGDVLYSLMMFFIFRFVFLTHSHTKIAMFSIGLCFLIEISQLYHSPWIDGLRNSTLGSLTLGHGFLWSDLAAYTLGGLLGIWLDQRVFRTYK